MSSTASSVPANNTAVVNALVAEFQTAGTLTLANLTAFAMAIAQAVLQSISPEISTVIDVLKALASGSALTDAEKAQLLLVIETVIPSVLAFMTQIEQGAVTIAGKVVAEVEQEASSIWSWCTKKSTVTTPTPPNSPTAAARVQQLTDLVPPA